MMKSFGAELIQGFDVFLAELPLAELGGELLGQFTYVYLRNGIFGLNARGLVAVFGQK